MSPSSVSIQPGTVIDDKFMVEQVLASSSMGMTVAARHLHLDERIVLKFLSSEALSGAMDLARFCRQAQAALRLRNEHVARVTEIGTLENGCPYIIMEYLVGHDLAELLRRDGALPYDVGISHVLQTCEAIAEAHSLGLIHGSIKPSNLFVARRGDGSPVTKVLDFGMPRPAPIPPCTSGENARREKHMFCSEYMPPEQLRGTGKLDERADIWALGVVLYELLEGAAPFAGEDPGKMISAVTNNSLPPLRVCQLEFRKGLYEVTSTCLQKRPEDRYQSVAELAYALKPYAAGPALTCVAHVAAALGSKARYRTQTSTMRKLAPATEVALDVPTKPQHARLLWIGLVAGILGIVVLIALALWM